MRLKVHSLRVEHIRTYNDRDGEFEDNSKYILNCISEHNLKYEVSFWTEYGDCPSGWCGASWGRCTVRRVYSFIGSTHKPVKDLSFEIRTKEGDLEDIISNTVNEIFYVDDDGGDKWYSCGGVGITEELLLSVTNINIHLKKLSQKLKESMKLFTSTFQKIYKIRLSVNEKAQ